MSSTIRLAARGTALALGGGLLVATVTMATSPSPGKGLEAAASPIVMPEGDLAAGTTYAVEDPEADGGRLLLTVPASGWSSIGGWVLGKDVIPDDSYTDYDIRVLLEAFDEINLFADPCSWADSALEPPVGPTLDDLATAFVAQPMQNAASVSDITLGGHAGKKVELSVPDDVDLAACGPNEYRRWYFNGRISENGPFLWGKDQRDVVYVVDVDGTRWMIDAHIRPGVPETDLAELEQLLGSIRFETPTASPSAPS